MPGSKNFSFYRGDTFAHQFMFGNDGGRYSNDGVSDGTNTLRSNLARWTPDDQGVLLADRDDLWIPDGTYIIAVAIDGKSVTCSAAIPDNTGVGPIRFVTRASDLTNFTVKADAKTSKAANNPAWSFNLDVTRKRVGIVIVSKTSVETKSLNGQSWVYDLQIADTAVPPNVSTLVSGGVSIDDDVTA